MSSKNQAPAISIRVPPTLRAQLVDIARERGLTRHGAMVLAIRQFVESQAKTPAA